MHFNYTFRTPIIIVLCAAAMSLSFKKTVEIDSIDFYAEGQEKTLTELISQAKADGQRPVVYFHANWCKACQGFNENSAKKKAAKELTNFRFIKIDVDIDKTELSLIDKYEIDSVPTILEIDENEEVKRTVTGDKFGGGSPEEIALVFMLFDYVK